MIRTRALTALAAGALLVLAGCSSDPGSSTGDSPDTAPAPGAASGEMYGCTDAVLAYIADLSYPDAEPLDPATLAFPDGLTIATTPDCLVVTEFGGSPRYGALFAGDGLDAVAEVDAALETGGYQQSDDYGPYVWWSGGDDPLTAEHSISAGPQVIDGQPWMWITY